MATQKLSVMARISAAVEKISAKANRKLAERTTAVEAAMKIAGVEVEFLKNGKTIIIAHNDVKVGVINGGGIQACAVTADDIIGYVKVTAKELAEYVKEISARDKKA